MTDDADVERALRAGDPAAALPALPSTTVHDLTEHAMTTSPSPVRPLPGRPARDRRRLVLGSAIGLVGAAVAAAIAVPLLLASGGTTALRAAAGDPLTTACARVSTTVDAADVAFRGEVVSIEGGTATLRVLQRYAGDVAGTVTVAQGGESAVDGAAPAFTDGGDYLVAAKDGAVLSCGATGPDDPALRALYDRAFR